MMIDALFYKHLAARWLVVPAILASLAAVSFAPHLVSRSVALNQTKNN